MATVAVRSTEVCVLSPRKSNSILDIIAIFRFLRPEPSIYVADVMERLEDFNDSPGSCAPAPPSSDMLSGRTGKEKSHPQHGSIPKYDHVPGDPDTWPDRNAYDKESWGYVCPVPEPGTIERAHLFVKPYPMADQDKKRILANYRKALLSHGKGLEGDCSLLGDHLRPGETPSERAETDLQTLDGLGVETTADIRAGVVDRHQESLGLRGALAAYLEGETHCELKYVNELLRQLDRLQLEAATQLSCLEISNEKKLRDKDAVIARLEEQLETTRQRKSQEVSRIAAQAQQLVGQLHCLGINHEAMGSESKELEPAFHEIMKARNELSVKLRSTENRYTSAMARAKEERSKADEYLAQKIEANEQLEISQNNVSRLEERIELLSHHFQLLHQRTRPR